MKQIPKLREVPMQHKGFWQDTMMNWRGYFQQSSWRHAKERSVWWLRMRPRGRRRVTGLAFGSHQALASVLKWFLQDGRWRTTRAGALPQLSQPLRRNPPAGLLDSSRLSWRLSPLVPPVKSNRARPDGKTDNAQYVLVHFVWLETATNKAAGLQRCWTRCSFSFLGI